MSGESRRVVVLGSTGSVGTQGLAVIRRNPGRFRVAALAAAGTRPQVLAEQIVEFAPDLVAVAEPGAAEALPGMIRAAAWHRGLRPAGYPLPVITAGPESALDAARWPADVVLNALPGAAGLAVLDSEAILALANKESLVTGGPLVKSRARPGQIVCRMPHRVSTGPPPTPGRWSPWTRRRSPRWPWPATARRGAGPAVYNAASETLVAAFRDGRLPFPAIVDTIAAVIADHDPPAGDPGLAGVLAADARARDQASRLVPDPVHPLPRRTA
jgi:1-deoxy-D-xylulose 5-phosphate reductoisomerase